MIAEKLHADQNFNFKDGLFFQNQFPENDFESTYIELRKKEGRIFSNSDIAKLPEVDRNHQHLSEWKIRQRSSSRLFDYLNQKREEKLILEIGCGNGWLSHMLSRLKNTHVIGLDVNVTELQQAVNVFQRISNLTFIKGDVFTLKLPVKTDYVVLASSVQYFPDFTELVKVLLKMLSNNGEIHILDSPFYDHHNVRQARQRSDTYFSAQNSKMIDHYNHHTWQMLSQFNFQILYNPTSVISKLKNKIQLDSPFPWIRITQPSNGK